MKRDRSNREFSGRRWIRYSVDPVVEWTQYFSCLNGFFVHNLSVKWKIKIEFLYAYHFPI